MYGILKSVIEKNNFSLREIEHKIDTLWTENKLSEEQRDELITLARANAKAEYNIDLYAAFVALDERVSALENNETVTNTNAPPEWHLGMQNKRGDRVSFEGKIYRCIAPEGFSCSWAPYGEHGYPPYWEAE